MTMALRVFIVDDLNRLTDTQKAVLEEITAARCEQYLADRARYIPPSQNAIVAARLAQTSGAENARNMAVGSHPPAREKLPLTSDGYDPACLDCLAAREDGLSRNGACATHRRACEGCGRDDVSLHGDLVGEKGLAELWCDHCDTPAAVGEKFADAQADPWDLASEELATTRDLPREEPKYWGRDRGEFDPLDDKIDLQPFGRTTK